MWDWAHINQHLPRKNRASDIDGIVELDHHYLLLEGKRPGQTLPTGQRILFDHLLQDLTDCTLLTIHGDPAGLGHPVSWQVKTRAKTTVRETDGWDDICAWIDQWVDRVDR